MLIDVGDTCSFGDVTLGQTDDYGVEMYFTGIDGRGAVGSTVQAQRKAAGDGAFPSPAYLTERVFTVSAGLVAPDRPSLIAAFDRVQAAASINAQQVWVTAGGAQRYALAQRQGEVTIKDESELYMLFDLQFLAGDPRWFADDLIATAQLPSATGGLTVPLTVPFTIASSVISGTCALTNPGNMVGKVSLRIDGPCTGPVITHVASGAQLVIASSYALVAGNWLEIDMDAHTVRENGQADRSAYVTSRGWSGFDPGDNEWAFTASAPDPAALLTVTATPAWL